MTRLFAGTPFDIPPTCDVCGEVESQCSCDPADKERSEQERIRESLRKAPSEQTASVGIEKRKGNRKVTVVRGLSSQANDLPELLSKLQAGCGTGGTVKPSDDLIELQGDHCHKVRSMLAELGYGIA